MRRFLLLPVLLAAFGCACATPPDVRDLRLVEVGPFSATIAFTTNTPARFTAEYGEGRLLDNVASETVDGIDHRLRLTGLKPSTRFTYRLEPGGLTRTFRTAPGSEGAFDLVALAAGESACAPAGPAPEPPPDIVVAPAACAGPLTSRPGQLLRLPYDAGLKFGGVFLQLAPSANALAAAPDGARRVVVLPAVPSPVPEALRDAVLLSPTAAFAAGQRIDWPADRLGWFEIDAFEIAWVDALGGRRDRRVIVAAPPETKKTCLFCDRLLEAGRYEESIAWYRAFIAANAAGHEVEDAYYQVARLLDEKLFRYPEAIDAHEEFLARYPASRRAVPVQFRLAFLGARSDDDFAPLRAFEKAKAEFVRDRPAPAVAAVEEVLAAWPEAAVAQDAFFWLAHLLERDEPGRALDLYARLIARFPKSDNAAMAAVAIGDIHYRAKRYRTADAAYEAARAVAPATFEIALADKQRKSARNLKREIARYLSWAILAAWLVASVWWRAVPGRGAWWAGAVALAAYVVVGGGYFALNFARAKPLLAPLALLFVTMSLVLIWNRALGARRVAAPLVAAHALTASAATLYLVWYHTHQLYVFGL
jgi:tetratricopeptide (TPR) repeat protein